MKKILAYIVGVPVALSPWALSVWGLAHQKDLPPLLAAVVSAPIGLLCLIWAIMIVERVRS